MFNGTVLNYYNPGSVVIIPSCRTIMVVIFFYQMSNDNHPHSSISWSEGSPVLDGKQQEVILNDRTIEFPFQTLSFVFLIWALQCHLVVTLWNCSSNRLMGSLLWFWRNPVFRIKRKPQVHHYTHSPSSGCVQILTKGLYIIKWASVW